MLQTSKISQEMIQDELELFVDSPWDCDGLDPFRDDPVQTDNVCFEKDNSENSVCGLDSDDIQNCPCSCGNCPEMPSKDEQVCCRSLTGWQKEYNSKGDQYSLVMLLVCEVSHKKYGQIWDFPPNFRPPFPSRILGLNSPGYWSYIVKTMISQISACKNKQMTICENISGSAGVAH